MPNLTEKKKADRIKMAELVRALAVEMGLTAEVVDKPFGNPLIQTRHGIGYRIAAPDSAASA